MPRATMRMRVTLSYALPLVAVLLVGAVSLHRIGGIDGGGPSPSRARRDVIVSVLVGLAACAGAIAASARVRPPPDQTAAGAGALLPDVRREANEIVEASLKVRACARWFLEHTWAQSSSASEMAATLHRMNTASARSAELARELRARLVTEPSEQGCGCEAGIDCCCGEGRGTVDSCGQRASTESLLELAGRAADEIGNGVARVNSMVLAAESVAAENAMKAQELWFAAEALSRRATALQSAANGSGETREEISLTS